MSDVHSTLVDKISDGHRLTDAEKMVVLGALCSIDYRKFFSMMCQAAAPIAGAQLAHKLMKQAGKA